MASQLPQSIIDVALATKILHEISTDKMGGWFDLPYTIQPDLITAIKSTATHIQSTSKVLVCIGIGGSYLGHRAVIEALKPTSPTRILYAGNSLSSKDLRKTISEIGDDDFSLLVISKSGTTLEPAVAFRIMKSLLVKKYGTEEAKKRIYCITDNNSGTLHDEAVAYGYTQFAIPDNIGGRYSVLTPVGLLPMAVAGVNIDLLLAGARNCREKQLIPGHLDRSALLNYAFTRRFLYEHGIHTEVLASFEPSMLYFHEWWKQLFGESEGKSGTGLFPASVIYTTDLHSLGQYMQDGSRDIFETFIHFTSPRDTSTHLIIPASGQNNNDLLSFDKLTFIAGKSLEYLNQVAFDATVTAHDRGGISTITIEMTDTDLDYGLNERSLGFLIYFFEVACAVSAKLNGVNPFDQPGVEEYKKEINRVLRPATVAPQKSVAKKVAPQAK